MDKSKIVGLWIVRVEEDLNEFEYFGTEAGLAQWFKHNALTITSHRLIYSAFDLKSK